MYIVHTKHVPYDLMDYITNRLSVQERKRVDHHLQKCSKCNTLYNELLVTEAVLKTNSYTAPTSVYYSTILPRLRGRLVSHRQSDWGSRYGISIVLPLAVSILLVFFLMRIPQDSSSDAAQTEALHQTVRDLNDDEIVQAVEMEYAGLPSSPNQEVAAAGVAEHLQGDQFLKSAVSNHIENEELSDMDYEEIISNLNREQVDKVLSGLSERNNL